MHRTPLASVGCLLFAGWLAVPLPAQTAEPPVRVFVLAGQSNMEGYGAVSQADAAGKELPGTLRSLLADPATRATYAHLVDERPTAAPRRFAVQASNAWFGDPLPGVHKQLHLVFRIDGKEHERTVDEGQQLELPAAPDRIEFVRATYGEPGTARGADVLAALRQRAATAVVVWRERDDVQVWFGERRGPLRPGFGAHAERFGVELQFGHELGEALAEPVAIVKTAWGGKSLFADFRPPSAGGEVGACYTQMIAAVRAALAEPGTVCDGWRGRRAELAGFVWWHGWNDGCDPEHAVPEYERNLVHLIHDVRRDLAAPKLPFVVAELTGPWVEPDEPQWRSIRSQQAAAARRPEWQGTVAFVPTAKFVRPESASPGGWACHEFDNAETYFLVGQACGEAMRALLPR